LLKVWIGNIQHKLLIFQYSKKKKTMTNFNEKLSLNLNTRSIGIRDVSPGVNVLPAFVKIDGSYSGLKDSSGGPGTGDNIIIHFSGTSGGIIYNTIHGGGSHVNDHADDSCYDGHTMHMPNGDSIQCDWGAVALQLTGTGNI
jgi:hypothetical protein